MTLPLVLDVSVALVAEGYLSLPGMDWWTALETAQEAGHRQVPETAVGEKVVVREKTEEEKIAENEAVMASLMAGLSQSSFKGARP